MLTNNVVTALLQGTVISFLVLFATFCVYMIIEENRPSVRAQRAADKTPGAKWKGYVNPRNGKTVVLPARISEEYLKSAYRLQRLPSLDYTIEE